MSTTRIICRTVFLSLALLPATACSTAQKMLDASGRAAENAAAREAAERADRGVSSGADAAEAAVMGSGTNGSTAGSTGDIPPGGTPAESAPGEGAWTNYDFVPGEEVLFAETFSNENVGDFPRRLEFVKGGMDIVEWDGRRFLRIGANDSRFAVLLPTTLPSRFTIEVDAHVGHSNAPVVVSTYEPNAGRRWHAAESRPYFFFDGAAGHASGIHQNGQPLAATEDLAIGKTVVTLRIMADGSHVKVYVDDRRVANHPQVELERTGRIFFSFPDVWPDQPVLVGNLRIASGGADLYDKIAEDGRAVTHGILFDVNSDQIRPESTPTLSEIGTMLNQHADLRLSIEGHTDASGSDVYNLELSQKRADAVRAYLVREYGVDHARLQAAGKGETQPMDTNDTPEGRQNNRRVELVRLG